MSVSSLPLSLIVDVSVSVSPVGSPGPQFNQALIVGSSTVISNTARLQQFTSLAGIATAGFSESSAEYLAAQIYFGQSPAPSYLWLGVQVLSALQTQSIDAAGSGYVVGDIITVTQAGASGGQLKVTTVSGGGDVTGVALVPQNQGTGYSAAVGLATTGGTGTGLTITITAVGETALQAVAACRLASPIWYACMFVASAVDADYEALAAFIQAASPASVFFLTSGEAAILNGTAGNLFATLQAASYSRTFMMYSTTQSGDFPNNIYASAAPMGYAMGANNG